MSSKLEVIESAQVIRQWCKSNLPFYESVVGYDLIIFLAISFLKNEKIIVKQLFTSLPHSYTAVRQHYMRLIKDGWIECIGDEQDGRIKHIKPTKKFETIITAYAEIIVSNTPPPRFN